ncbi:MAG: galactose-1-phosphate uridylyltransferase [Streptosporangiaceae bacterium]
MWKSTARLADGREIVYFDETPGLGRAAAPDGRDLPAPARAGDTASSGSGLRWDPLTGEWIAFAAHRQDRTFLPAAGSCPLCPSSPGRPTEIPAAGYDVVVFENRFPVLSGTGPSAVGVDGLGARAAATGRCEVICFTADHDGSFAALSPARVSTVLTAWADRTAELGGTAGIEHVFCFENRGAEVGATLQHPHGQTYALPFVPPRARQLLASAHAYQAGHGANLFDDMVAAEIADGRRIVQRNEHWVAFVPEAAHWPFEVLLFPLRRVPDLANLAEPAVAAFGEIYPAVLRRLDALFAAPMPYLAAWQQAPAAHASQDGTVCALFLQVMPQRRAPGKLKYMASTETGAGIWSNDVLPETAARMLREAG